MRLTPRQQQRIHRLVCEHLGEDAQVMLIGSRLRDDGRGGDVDLIIETPLRIARLEQAALKLDLENSLQLPVDIVFRAAGEPLTAFQALAKAEAQPVTSPEP